MALLSSSPPSGSASSCPRRAASRSSATSLPNLLAVNFVIQRLLGEGVSASTRSDPQAKSLGEYLRARVVDVPEALLG